MNDLLSQCEANIQQAYREYQQDPSELNGESNRTQLSFHLAKYFACHGDKIANGTVVWGRLVSLERDLQDMSSQRGAAVYALAPSEQAPDYLEELAYKISVLNTSAKRATELKEIAEYVDSKEESTCGIKVPEKISPHIDCGYSKLQLNEGDLPQGKREVYAFPMVLQVDDDKKSSKVTVVPAELWPSYLLQLWQS
ncbi:hypothetical protein [Persicirhabdus sediminis]|uniref:Uncharacterized protein n=1 Tax=Persicirhabdus sediminis TaxID=454144 RepID=A0A8J7SN64_9BACT|nr:hypothetical protein [Persicirhabdus sediminis]MBK1791508.1 hypothetical protein [Persicirhabdus sediminis]